MGQLGVLFPSTLLEVHSIYIYFEATQENGKEQEQLKEILYLIGTGLFESAYIRYAYIKPMLLELLNVNSIRSHDAGTIDILIRVAQFSLEELINE